ncbi:MAG: amino acid adenylation domain-containing protein [Magnetococcales bacterium]|nr:amino acid adenylation domain-containing protein [Magnetococcales bacterium]NGZ27872.1 amino acid adenylation domain-containing protein [Magnetococcales bacterium]
MLNYKQLADVMDKLARLLQDSALPRNGRVGLLLENSIEACMAMLGVLRADGCYVPLGTHFPAQRLADIVTQAGLHAVVVTDKHCSTLLQLEAMLEANPLQVVIVLNATTNDPKQAEIIHALRQRFPTVLVWEEIEHTQPPWPSRNVEEDLAYIMFTSGTTGKPKGVMITHRNINSYLLWAVKHFGFHPADRISNHSSITFDLSVMDIFGTFRAGATLCPVVSPGDRAFPGKFLKQQRITVWFSVPSVISMLRRSGQLQANAFAEHLRLALFCGEALPPDLAAAWLETHPQIPMHNLYGPTEATIACTSFWVNGDSPFNPQMAIPIGRPTQDTEILILDQEKDHPIPPGTLGRLVICGPQLSPGYWGQPELTAKVFQEHPLKPYPGARMYVTGDLAYMDEQGLIHFSGRVDDQVKLHGYRIELGEIDVALASIPELEEGVAVLMLHAPDVPELVATVVPKEEALANEQLVQQVLDHCRSQLPHYMVPGSVHLLSQLPRNPNGKVDRKKIKEIVASLQNGSMIK